MITIDDEIKRITKLYKRTRLDYARNCYNQYVSRILEDESKEEKERLLGLYERGKIKEDLIEIKEVNH